MRNEEYLGTKCVAGVLKNQIVNHTFSGSFFPLFSILQPMVAEFEIMARQQWISILYFVTLASIGAIKKNPA